MLTLTDVQLDGLCEHIPDPPRDPRGGRPPADQRRVVAGIFWMLDNGAKWKGLPARFGRKSTVHRGFTRWGDDGVFEPLTRAAGRVVEPRGTYKR